MRRFAFVPFLAATAFTIAVAWTIHGIDQAIRKAWS